MEVGGFCTCFGAITTSVVVHVYHRDCQPRGFHHCGIIADDQEHTFFHCGISQSVNHTTSTIVASSQMAMHMAADITRWAEPFPRASTLSHTSFANSLHSIIKDSQSFLRRRWRNKCLHTAKCLILDTEKLSLASIWFSCIRVLMTRQWSSKRPTITVRRSNSLTVISLSLHESTLRERVSRRLVSRSQRNVEVSTQTYHSTCGNGVSAVIFVYQISSSLHIFPGISTGFPSSKARTDTSVI